MHLFDVKTRLLGGYGIVGGQLPLATGAGLALVRQQRDDVVVCLMGDGTTNIGAFHESLNIAALWKLPVVYAIVDNGYGMGTTVANASAVPELYKKACAYGIPGAQLDGNDVLGVKQAVGEAVERARSERTPSLLDIVTYRLKGHSVVDPDRYRPEDYLQEIRAQEPVAHFGRQLREAGLLNDEQQEQLDEEVEREVNAAVEFAEASPEPNPANLFELSYATPVANQPHALPGEVPWQ
jgi:pyruvate dehydrogenase E1 component alpha subunit